MKGWGCKYRLGAWDTGHMLLLRILPNHHPKKNGGGRLRKEFVSVSFAVLGALCGNAFGQNTMLGLEGEAWIILVVLFVCIPLGVCIVLFLLKIYI